MSVYQAVLAYIGNIVTGYEVLVWIVSAVFGLYLLTSFFSLLASFIPRNRR